MGRHIEDFTTTNPLNTPQWQARINQQKLGNVGPQVPVFAYHGSGAQLSCDRARSGQFLTARRASGSALGGTWPSGTRTATWPSSSASKISGARS
jgi:hypothetical protein